MSGDVDHSWITLSSEALGRNLELVRERIGEDKMICACVKANAYGHGLGEIVHQILAFGIDWLAVFEVSDAVLLREQGIDVPILILSPVSEEQIGLCIQHELRFLVVEESQFEQIVYIQNTLGLPAYVHIPVETGMGRLGFFPSQVEDVLVSAQQHGIVIEGLMQHYATGDEKDSEYFRTQQMAFECLLDSLDQMGLTPEIIHAENSGASLIHPTISRSTLVRVGAALYGFEPSNEVTEILQQNSQSLTPVLEWKSQLVSVKTLPPGMGVSYGATKVLEQETRVGVVPVGYFDGYDRGLSNIGWMIIAGNRCPILGRVCMNMTMIDLSEVPEATIGDEVTLIGEGMSLELMATVLDTIPYEICTRIRENIHRKLI